LAFIGNPLRHIAGVPVLHWRGNTFTLPGNVELLASTHVYDNKAFRRGRNLLALQFHAEMCEDERFETWIGSSLIGLFSSNDCLTCLGRHADAGIAQPDAVSVRA
jgi:GMP synthase-like glutamine amidotransferase